MEALKTFSGKQILIVEDNDTHYMYVSEMLKPYQMELTRCCNGFDAFFHCMDASSRIDLIIMDLKLPEMNGFEATRLIKKYRPGLPIIALTASVMESDIHRCYSVGCDNYLSKPVLPPVFLKAISKYLQ